ncbi:Cysteine-rich receptor-like protein kinase 25-like protein [Balamuthia mandrillaris]
MSTKKAHDLFTGDNWQYYRQKIKNALHRHNLYDYAKNEVPLIKKPERDSEDFEATNKKYKEQQQTLGKVTYIICKQLDETKIGQYAHLPPHEIWKKLNDLYNHQDAFTIGITMAELNELTFDYDNFPLFLNKFDEIIDRLNKLGLNFDETARNSLLLGKARKYLHCIKGVQFANDPGIVRKLFMSEWSQQKASTNADDTAFQHRTNGNNNNNNNGNNGINHNNHNNHRHNDYRRGNNKHHGRGRYSRGGRGRGRGQRQYHNQQPNQDGKHCDFCNTHTHNTSDCRTMKKAADKLAAIEAAADATANMATTNTNTSSSSSQTNKDFCPWYIDSGASRHMSNKQDWFSSLRTHSPSKIFLGDNYAVPAIGTGTIKLQTNRGYNIAIDNVLYAPDLANNLVSVAALTDRGNQVLFKGNFCYVIDQKGETVATATKKNGNYPLTNFNIINNEQNTAYMATQRPPSTNLTTLWHRRLGHININSLRKLPQIVSGVTLGRHDFGTCIACITGKQHRTKINRAPAPRALSKLQLVHTDVCGPMQIPSIGGSRYFVTFTDDYTRKTWTYFLKNKNEVTTKFIEFAKLVTNQTGLTIKAVRSDGGGEYFGYQFKNALIQRGILHQRSAPYTPEQNGVAERKNRSIVEKALCLLQQAHLETRFWAEAVRMATIILNHVGTKALRADLTPEEAWTGIKPNLSHIHTFGCTAYALTPKSLRKKFDPHSTKCVYIGPAEDAKAHRLYRLETNRFFTSRDVTFIEDDFPFAPNQEPKPSEEDDEPYYSNTNTNTSTDDNSDTSSDSGDETPTPFVFEQDTNYLEANDELPEDIEHATTDSEDTLTSNPPSSEEIAEPGGASPSPSYILPSAAPAPKTTKRFAKRLKSATKSTKNPRQPKKRNVTWNMPLARTFNKSTTTATTTPTAQTERRYPLRSRTPSRKALEAAQALACITPQNRFTPRNYSEAISCPEASLWNDAMDSEVDSLTSNGTWILVPPPENEDINIVDCMWIYKIKELADNSVDKYKARLVARGFTQKLHHLDFVTAYLNAKLKQKIYMRQPPGYVDPQHPNWLCLLQKGLYGLRQSARKWNKTVHKEILAIGFYQSEADPCIYVKVEGGEIIILALYVDDVLLAAKTTKAMEPTKKQLSKAFKMKDLGEAKYILGIEIQRDYENKRTYLSQQKFISDTLEKYGMTNAKPSVTPLVPHERLAKRLPNEPKIDSNIPYQGVIGSLLWIMRGTRPDIAAALSQLTRFCSDPSKHHWAAAQHTLRYLKHTQNTCIVYDGNAPNADRLIGYTDADFGGKEKKQKSTSGYGFTLCGGPISWSSKKQSDIALSTSDAEYVAACHATKEAVWLRQLLKDLKLPQQGPTELFEDNQTAIKIAENPIIHDRSKHIDVKYHYVRQKVKRKEVKLIYVPSGENIADAMTKSLAGPLLRKHMASFGLSQPPDQPNRDKPNIEGEYKNTQ